MPRNQWVKSTIGRLAVLLVLSGPAWAQAEMTHSDTLREAITASLNALEKDAQTGPQARAGKLLGEVTDRMAVDTRK